MKRWVLGQCGAVAALTIAGSLTGCGGGSSAGSGGAASGSSSGVSIVAPSPAPTPAPTPVPTSSGLFGALGQTASQSFEVLGYSARGADSGFGYSADPASIDPTFAVGLRFAAPSALLFSVAGYGESTLVVNGASGTSPSLGLFSLGYSALGGTASLDAAYSREVAALLKSSAYGFWTTISNVDPEFPNLLVIFVYGVPTQPRSMPQNGAGNFESQAVNHVLTVDFAARTVSGTFLPDAEAGTGAFALRDVTFSGDGTAFRGQLVAEGTLPHGRIEGRFTGSAGEELIAKAVLPTANGQITAAVWAAERH